jgi:hypothetical protein
MQKQLVTFSGADVVHDTGNNRIILPAGSDPDAMASEVVANDDGRLITLRAYQEENGSPAFVPRNLIVNVPAFNAHWHEEL